MKRSRKTFMPPPPGMKPISREEYAAQAERMAAEEAAHQKAKADARDAFMESYNSIIPKSPVESLLIRVDQLERQVLTLLDWKATLDQVAEDMAKDGNR